MMGQNEDSMLSNSSSNSSYASNLSSISLSTNNATITNPVLSMGAIGHSFQNHDQISFALGWFLIFKIRILSIQFS